MLNTTITGKDSSALLSVSVSGGPCFIRPEDIIRLEASSNYTYFHFINRKPLLAARVLRDYELLLEGFGFLRVHRSHLVNRKHIRGIDNNGQIILPGDYRPEISRRKRKKVLEALQASSSHSVLLQRS